MNKFTNAKAKITNALFSDFGEQGILVKKADASQHEIYLLKQEKSFSVGKLQTTSSSIRIKSDIKPELYDQIFVNNEELLIKASPAHLGNGVYSIKVK